MTAHAHCWHVNPSPQIDPRPPSLRDDPYQPLDACCRCAATRPASKLVTTA